MPLKKPRRLTSPFVFTEVAALASQLVADGIEPVGSSSSDEACLRRAMHALAAQVVRNLSAKLLIARGQRHAAITRLKSWHAAANAIRGYKAEAALYRSFGRRHVIGGALDVWRAESERQQQARLTDDLSRLDMLLRQQNIALSPSPDRPRPLSPHTRKRQQQEQQRSKLQRRWTARQPENKVYLAPQTPPQRAEQTFQQPSGRRRRQKKPRQQREPRAVTPSSWWKSPLASEESGEEDGEECGEKGSEDDGEQGGEEGGGERHGGYAVATQLVEHFPSDDEEDDDEEAAQLDVLAGMHAQFAALIRAVAIWRAAARAEHNHSSSQDGSMPAAPRRALAVFEIAAVASALAAADAAAAITPQTSVATVALMPPQQHSQNVVHRSTPRPARKRRNNGGCGDSFGAASDRQSPSTWWRHAITSSPRLANNYSPLKDLGSGVLNTPAVAPLSECAQSTDGFDKVVIRLYLSAVRRSKLAAFSSFRQHALRQEQRRRAIDWGQRMRRLSALQTWAWQVVDARICARLTAKAAGRYMEHARSALEALRFAARIHSHFGILMNLARRQHLEMARRALAGWAQMAVEKPHRVAMMARAERFHAHATRCEVLDKLRRFAAQRQYQHLASVSNKVIATHRMSEFWAAWRAHAMLATVRAQREQLSLMANARTFVRAWAHRALWERWLARTVATFASPRFVALRDCWAVWSWLGSMHARGRQVSLGAQRASELNAFRVWTATAHVCLAEARTLQLVGTQLATRKLLSCCQTWQARADDLKTHRRVMTLATRRFSPFAKRTQPLVSAWYDAMILWRSVGRFVLAVQRRQKQQALAEWSRYVVMAVPVHRRLDACVLRAVADAQQRRLENGFSWWSQQVVMLAASQRHDTTAQINSRAIGTRRAMRCWMRLTAMHHALEGALADLRGRRIATAIAGWRQQARALRSERLRVSDFIADSKRAFKLAAWLQWREVVSYFIMFSQAEEHCELANLARVLQSCRRAAAMHHRVNRPLRGEVVLRRSLGDWLAAARLRASLRRLQSSRVARSTCLAFTTWQALANATSKLRARLSRALASILQLALRQTLSVWQAEASLVSHTKRSLLRAVDWRRSHFRSFAWRGWVNLMAARNTCKARIQWLAKCVKLHLWILAMSSWKEFRAERHRVSDGLGTAVDWFRVGALGKVFKLLRMDVESQYFVDSTADQIITSRGLRHSAECWSVWQDRVALWHHTQEHLTLALEFEANRHKWMRKDALEEWCALVDANDRHANLPSLIHEVVLRRLRMAWQHMIASTCLYQALRQASLDAVLAMARFKCRNSLTSWYDHAIVAHRTAHILQQRAVHCRQERVFSAGFGCWIRYTEHVRNAADWNSELMGIGAEHHRKTILLMRHGLQPWREFIGATHAEKEALARLSRLCMNQGFARWRVHSWKTAHAEAIGRQLRLIANQAQAVPYYVNSGDSSSTAVRPITLSQVKARRNAWEELYYYMRSGCVRAAREARRRTVRYWWDSLVLGVQSSLRIDETVKTLMERRRRVRLGMATSSWRVNVRATQASLAQETAKRRSANRYAILRRLSHWRYIARRSHAVERCYGAVHSAWKQRTFFAAFSTWRAAVRGKSLDALQRSQCTSLRLSKGLSQWRAQLEEDRRRLSLETKPQRVLCAARIRRVQRKLMALQSALWLRCQGDEAAFAAVSTLRTLRAWVHALRRALAIAESHSADPQSSARVHMTLMGPNCVAFGSLRAHEGSATQSSPSSPARLAQGSEHAPDWLQTAASAVGLTPVAPSPASPALTGPPHAGLQLPADMASSDTLGIERRELSSQSVPPFLLVADSLYTAFHAMQRQRLVSAALRGARRNAAFYQWRQRWELRAWELRFLRDAETARPQQLMFDYSLYPEDGPPGPPPWASGGVEESDEATGSGYGATGGGFSRSDSPNLTTNATPVTAPPSTTATAARSAKAVVATSRNMNPSAPDGTSQ